MKLLDAVDRKVSGLVLDETDLDRRIALGLHRARVLEAAQIGCTEARCRETGTGRAHQLQYLAPIRIRFARAGAGLGRWIGVRRVTVAGLIAHWLSFLPQ
jgi:hypothetical protein